MFNQTWGKVSIPESSYYLVLTFQMEARDLYCEGSFKDRGLL